MRFLSIFLFCFVSIQSVATLNDVDKAYFPNINILQNPGFENGKQRWAASAGTFTTVTSGTNLLTGLVSATWDAAASSNTLTTTAIAIPKGLYGKNGVVFCTFQTPTGTATHELQAFDGSNILGEVTITSNTQPKKSSASFIFPTSGNISLRVFANANEPLIAIDDCYLGEAFDLPSPSVPALAGSSYFAQTANCASWARTSTTVGAFSTDADCPGPTIDFSALGTWATTDVNLPEQTITNLPAGRYKAKFVFPVVGNGNNYAAFAINDGTTTCRAQMGTMITTSFVQTQVECFFTYLSLQSSVSFELYAGSSTSTLTVDISAVTPASAGVVFTLEYWPVP